MSQNSCDQAFAQLADYLLSDEYAEKSEKNISNKQRWVDKAKGELK